MSETSQASSDNERRNKSKKGRGPRRRQTHNAVERRRKDKINGWITRIGELLPPSKDHKPSKISILEQTVDYIKLLTSEREKLLSENRSEVQAEEVKQLQKELTLVQEQNTVYEKLLHQANISLNTLPKKALKYSGRFEKRNGVLTVKNSDLNIGAASHVDTSGGGIPTVAIPPKKTHCPLPKKNKLIAKKPVVTSSSIVTSVKQTTEATPVDHQVSGLESTPAIQVSEAAFLNPTTVHSGGVTAALSQFPLMSTTADRTIVLQPPLPERPNSFSIVCPNNTFLLPQQLFSVSSRNVSLSSAGILVINPNSVANFSASSGIILPTTLPSAEPGSVQTHPHSVVPASFSTNSSSSGIILPPSTTLPFAEPTNVQTHPNAVVPANFSTNSKMIVVPSQTVVNVPPVTIDPPPDVTAPVDTPHKSAAEVPNPFDINALTAAPPVSISSSVVSSKLNNQSTNSMGQETYSTLPSVPIPVPSLHKENKSSLTTTLSETVPPESSVNISTSEVSPKSPNSARLAAHNFSPPLVARETNSRNSSESSLKHNYKSPNSRTYNSLPSLQVLSANKIISLASQKGRKPHASLLQKEAAATTSLPNPPLSPHIHSPACLDKKDVAQLLNNHCAQTHEPEQVSACKKDASPTQDVPVSSMQVKKPDPASKSNFSLTVLMGNSTSEPSGLSRSVLEEAAVEPVAILTSTTAAATPVRDSFRSSLQLNTLLSEKPAEDATKTVKKLPNCDNAKTTFQSATFDTPVNNGSQYLNMCSKTSPLACKSVPPKQQAGYEQGTTELVNTAFGETVVGRTMNQTMPAVFPSSQALALHSSSSVFMCPLQGTNDLPTSSETCSTNLPPYDVLNKENANSSFPLASVSNQKVESTLQSSDQGGNFTPGKEPQKKVAVGEPLKQTPNSKKKKNGQKIPTAKEMQTICSTSDVMEISTHFELNKPPSRENSFSKQEFSNTIFTSDILARATESIFETDMLDSPHPIKETIMYYADNSLNVPVPIPDKQNNNYKFHCMTNGSQAENMQSSNSKKNLETNHIFSNHSHLHHNQEHQKQMKARKAKSNLDLAPPLKKLKEGSDIKSSNHQNFQNIVEKSPLTGSPDRKQTSNDNSVLDSITHFGNQIHIPESKTPTSVDSIFSLTPMLGDILKDVSHGMENNRNSFLSGNENLFPGDKHFLSSFTNSNEEYLNLPRMHFPVSSEISSVTSTANVSFALSLCTQNDSSKTTATISVSPSESKTADGHHLLSSNTMAKPPDFQTKSSPSEQPSFILPKASTSSNIFNGIAPTVHVSSSNIFHTAHASSSNISRTTDSSLNVSHTSSNLFYTAPTVQASSQMTHASGLNISHTTNSMISQSDSRYAGRDNVPFYPPTLSSNPQTFVSNSSSVLPHASYHSFPLQNNATFQAPPSGHKVDALSHSLCSLLKETSSILVENRTTPSTPLPPSKYFQDNRNANTTTSQSKYSALSLISDHNSYSEPQASCHQEYVHSSVSDTQYTSVSSCNRSQRAGLSYSAESLLCASSDKSKNKNVGNNRYPPCNSDKKSNGMADTNIFMPVSSCDIQMPLPPVTSFHNFSSGYTLCDTVPSTTIFNSAARTHDVPLSLSNENFLNHMNLSVESQMLGNQSSAVPKPHMNINLPFESHAPLYNNCNFLPHVKPNLETPPTSFGNSFPQQKANCCHFPPDHPPFPHKPPNFQPNRTPSLQPPQSNTNFVGNLFYNDTGPKPPSNVRPSQDSFVPDLFPGGRKAPNRSSKSKKTAKPASSDIMLQNSNSNLSQERNKPNNYFKNNVPCSQLNKTPPDNDTFFPPPVPAFNLSNILPDMGCHQPQAAGPARFPPPPQQHIVSHQPPLYPPPPPPLVRPPLNPQAFGENAVPFAQNPKCYPFFELATK